MNLVLTAVPGIPEIRPGDDLAAIIVERVRTAGLTMAVGDVLVICQKIVSKAEGRFVSLADIRPGTEAVEIATRCGKDPRFVQVVLDQAERIVRTAPGVIIVRNRLGLTMANAGIDQSNIPDGNDRILLLPENPDASAARLSEAVGTALGASVGVIISDSSGRAWRNGVIGICIGCAGLKALEDRRGEKDRNGRELKVTQVGVADEIAAAAALLTGEAAEGLPVVIVSGLPERWLKASGSAADLVRPVEQDLFL
jgi:coenzyme F420-0:L-glutamate ligase/coenzyme F420-1:gamma-L-glutamate ligase